MKNLKAIKKNFMLPAVNTSIKHGCVTPLYNIFSWQHNSTSLQGTRSSLRGTKQSESGKNKLYEKVKARPNL